MSADLFAEFNDSSAQSNTNPPPHAHNHTSTNNSLSPSWTSDHPPTYTGSNDLFGPGGSGQVPSTAQQNSQPWPGSQPDPASMSGWRTTTPQVSQQASNVKADDDDDGWGDFEVAEATQKTTANPTPAPGPSQSTAWNMSTTSTYQTPASRFNSHHPGPEPNTRLSRAPTIDIMTNTLLDFDSSSKGKQETPAAPDVSAHHRRKPKAVPKSGPRDPSVLFDAEDFELQEGEYDDQVDDEEDDFGDFESVTPQPSAAPPSVFEPGPSRAPPRKAAPAPTTDTAPSIDLLSLDDTPQDEPSTLDSKTEERPPSQLNGALSFGKPAATGSSRADTATRKPTRSISETSKANNEPTTRNTRQVNNKKAKAVAVEQGDHEWAAWDDFNSQDTVQNGGIDKTAPPENWDWDTTETSSKTQANKPVDDAPPPVNVPPPSVILSAFPDLLNTGNALLKPIAGQGASIKQRVLSDPQAAGFLEGYILIATTAARVIAGRKHRWHRDKILAKSMSISAAGSKGMKLAGVDKTQAAREDREAADVVAAWREHVGRLRSAVAAAKGAGKTNHLRVPELSESPQVQTAKLVPTAAKPCVICGLKREERVAKVDVEVEDSFGEWWIEHWGHRACRNFWIEHERNLRQR